MYFFCYDGLLQDLLQSLCTQDTCKRSKLAISSLVLFLIAKGMGTNRGHEAGQFATRDLSQHQEAQAGGSL